MIYDYDLIETVIGRKPKIKSPEEMSCKIINYLDNCKKDDQPLTITGLTMAIGFASRNTLREYEQKPEYRELILAAKLIVENSVEKALYDKSKVQGAIFVLKNMGWCDRQEINHGGQQDNAINTSVEVTFVGSNKDNNS